MFVCRVREAIFLGMCLGLLFCTLSCQLLDTILDGSEDRPSHGKNGLLHLPQIPKDAVVVDVYKIRVPYSKRDLVQELWKRTDTHDIPVELRNELYDKGIMIGTLGGNIPVELSRLLELKDQPITSPIAEKQRNAAEEMKSPQLTVRHSTVIRQGTPASIETCDPLERLSIFETVDGEKLGKSYYKAFGVIQLACKENDDGSVEMTVIPEVHYGDLVSRPVAQEGVMFIEKARRKITLDHLTVKLDLLLGQWLIVGPTGVSGGLGNRIFVQDMGDPEQKLLAFRIVRTQRDGIHDRNDIATLDWIPDENDLDEDKDERPLSSEITRELGHRNPFVTAFREKDEDESDKILKKDENRQFLD